MREKDESDVRFFGVFTRSFTLPSNDDTKNISVNPEDTVPKVVIPKIKAEKAKTCKIKIK